MFACCITLHNCLSFHLLVKIQTLPMLVLLIKTSEVPTDNCKQFSFKLSLPEVVHLHACIGSFAYQISKDCYAVHSPLIGMTSCSCKDCSNSNAASKQCCWHMVNRYTISNHTSVPKKKEYLNKSCCLQMVFIDVNVAHCLGLTLLN